MERERASSEVIIVGAGLAGLACARELAKAGVAFQILESSDAVGGRVRTDNVDGFLLDRGFQVLLTAYPEARRVLDYDALDLRPFFNGADIHWSKRFWRAADPISHPVNAFFNAASPVGSFHDKWFVLLLRQELQKLQHLPREMQEIQTEELLRIYGFSPTMIDRFFRPFFGGIFLERELRTSSRVFQFIFAMLAQGDIAVPAKGMQMIPEQLASRLPAGSIRLGSPVQGIHNSTATLASGEQLSAPHIVIATDEGCASRLLGESSPKAPAQRTVTCLYFSTDDQSLSGDPIIFLDGEGRGPVNNVAIMSNVAPAYAPEGKRLVSATVLGSPNSTELESTVREQLTTWFGPGVQNWKLLRSYNIPNAHPESRQLHTGCDSENPVHSPGLYRCGDHLENVSINGALLSGRRAAEAVLANRCG
jgi:phytoene dehydrogenase-like protein